MKKKNNELENIETEVNQRIKKYFYGDNELIDTIAKIVFAGYIWAKECNFNIFFNKEKFHDHEKYAEEKLKKIYSSKKLSYVINEMINRQAEVIWLRRIHNGDDDSYDFNNYDKDNWEAKRYIAFLFCEEILNRCIKDGACPDFSVNFFSNEIIELLKSLSVEEYCRIKGYLAFLNRNSEEGNSQNIHGLDQKDFLDAMGNLDLSFKNCSKRKRKRLHPVVSKILKSKNKEAIKQAKYNPQDRIGYINQEAINNFVNNFYPLIEKIEHCDKKEPKQVISDLYNIENTKIINMAEFMLKCMIASYIDEDDYKDARSKAGKKTIKKKHSPDKLIDPIFY